MFTSRPARVLLFAVLLAAIPLAGGLSVANASEDPVGVGISVGVVVPTGGPQPDWVATVPFGNSAPLAEMTVTVKNLQPFSPIEAYLHSTPVLFATGKADAVGTAVLTGRLPSGVPAGEHTITINAIARSGLAFTSTVLTFTVTADGILQAQTPTSTAKPKPPVAGPASASTGNVTGVTQTVVSGPAAEAAALGSDAFSLGGILMVSGVTSHTVLTASPTGGDTVLEFTLKNVSAFTVTSSLRFWLQNAVGLPIAEISGVMVTNQATDETRTVAVTIANVGQYGVYNAFVTLTPPETVGGTGLSPLTRDAPMFVLPIFVLIILFVGGVLFTAIRNEVLRRRRAAEAAAEEADAALGFDSDEVAQEVLV